MKPPIIGVTLGDPGGIGPEVTVKALARLKSDPHFPRAFIVLFGPLHIFEWWSRRIRRSLPLVAIPSLDASFLAKGRIHVMDEGPPTRAGAFFLERGRISKRSGSLAERALRTAARAAVRGRIQALVTAPVTKWAIQRTHRSFEGQTEYLARAFRARAVVMMFVSDRLRVALLSRHVALRDVSRLITPTLVRQTVRVVNRTLRDQFGMRRPRLAVCGLNPHAGEHGRFGDEEHRVLVPALRRLRREGIRLEGPFAADGLFVYAERYDAILSWYHDQGLIPFKLVARDAGCQLSAGLPVVRSSPDHGSALDIAGKGVAEPGSMQYALALALRLIRAQTRS